MAKTYTVQDSATGKNITFAWGGAEPPTEEDMAHVTEQATSAPPQQAAEGNDGGVVGGVPEWGRKHPNVYAGVETALDLAPMLGSFAKTTGIGIPAAAAINAGAKATQRKIAGEPTTLADVGMDALKGATVEGVGRGINAGIKGLADFVPQDAKNKAGRWLMQSAMKFSTSPKVLTPQERNAITETMFKNKFLPNDESYLKLQNAVERNTKAVDNIIEQGTAHGDTIPAIDIVNNGDIAGLLQYGKNVKSVAPEFESAVQKHADNVLNEGVMTPAAVNASKKQVYKELESAYGDNTLHTPNIQAKKQLAKGMKTALEQVYPEIKNLNANSAELLALSDHLARSMGRIGNRDVIGLGDKIVMDMVTGKAANPATAAAGILSLIDRPQIKARVAQMLYKAHTGNNLPLSQWRKGAKYLAQVAAPAARTAFEGAMYTSDPLGLRSGE